MLQDQIGHGSIFVLGEVIGVGHLERLENVYAATAQKMDGVWEKWMRMIWKKASQLEPLELRERAGPV